MKKAMKIIGSVVLFLVLVLAIFILYITITDYKPEKVEWLIEKQQVPPLEQDTLNLMNWNIGYAGLGKEMDFFYDGGKRVRPTEKLSRKYLNQIKTFIESNSADFWLLQEVDVSSKRSYFKDEVKEIEQLFESFTGVFAKNYDVPFVPVPVYEPLGAVHSGMLNFSKHKPAESIRYAYPLIASWPDKLFLLDRCFILNRYPHHSGKDLVVINTHNSAYVYDSALRVHELQILKDVLVTEYKKGNFVIAGGDWNQNPPGFEPQGDFNGHKYFKSEVQMDLDFLAADWTWAYGNTAPTNRQNYQAFFKGENPTTCLDYYVASPNIEVLNVWTVDLDFEDSDHNPVYLEVVLKP